MSIVSWKFPQIAASTGLLSGLKPGTVLPDTDDEEFNSLTKQITQNHNNSVNQTQGTGQQVNQTAQRMNQGDQQGSQGISQAGQGLGGGQGGGQQQGGGGQQGGGQQGGGQPQGPKNVGASSQQERDDKHDNHKEHKQHDKLHEHHHKHHHHHEHHSGGAGGGSGHSEGRKPAPKVTHATPEQPNQSPPPVVENTGQVENWNNTIH